MIVPDPDAPGMDLVKVLDFGIAKIMERERSEGPESGSGPSSSSPPSSALTMVGALVGTPEYMSPEQSLGLPVDPRSDVYACGVLLFYLVTGKLPFSGSSPIDVMMQQADKPAPAPSVFQPGLHAGLERVILKALAKTAEARQQSAAELAAELAAVLPELATSVRKMSLAGASSDRGAALLGVPSAVVIKAPVMESDPPPPPETMRSPPTAGADTTPVVIAAVKGREVAKTPVSGMARTPVSSLEKTLAVATSESPPAVERVPPVVVIAPPPPAPVAEEPAAAPVDVVVAAADPPREERRPLVAAAPSAEDAWVAPAWLFALAVAVGSVLIWLVRFLRFG
jgi:eukaryotic-like serine/threonine-protein kinase